MTRSARPKPHRSESPLALLRGEPRPRRSALLSYLVLAGLAILLVFPACTEEATKPPPQGQGAGPTPQPEQAPATQPSEGFAFWNGRYVAPPYRIEVVDGAVQLNGKIIRPRPGLRKAGDPTPIQVPAQPQNAFDLINTAAKRLQEKKLASYQQVTPQVRAELVALLKSFPAAKTVADEKTSIVVTDNAGETAALQLLVVPPPSMDELMQGQNERAAGWQQQLQSGDVLLLSPGAELTVPAHQSGVFLRDLLAVFDQPVARRVDLLTRLTGVPSMAQGLVSAGAPPAGLRDRLPPAAPPGPSSRLPAGGRVGGALLSPLPDDASHQQSRTPTSNRAVFLMALGYSRTARPAVTAARVHGYEMHILEGQVDVEGSGPGDVTVKSFLDTSGRAGILYFDAHGSETSINIEQYQTRSARDAAYQTYVDQGTPVGRRSVVDALLLGGIDETSWKYFVEITPTTIAGWKGSETIVQLVSCSTSHLGAAFLAAGAREFLAPAVQVCGADALTFNEAFWPRVAGTMDDGAKRNVIDAYNAVPNPLWRHSGDGKTVLSPAVASHTPKDGESIPVGQDVRIRVTFDVPISPSGGLVLVSGSCGLPYVNVGRWESDRAFSFSVRALHPGDAEVSIKAQTVIGKDNGASLDGNTYPDRRSHVGPNHVGPNRDDDYTWKLRCVDSPPTAAPTQNRPPVVSPIKAEMGSGNSRTVTTYSLTVSDPDNDTMTPRWQYPHPGCGVFEPAQNSVEGSGVVQGRWFHVHGGCHGLGDPPDYSEPNPEHANTPVVVTIMDTFFPAKSRWEVTCTYIGVQTGTGPACSAPVWIDKENKPPVVNPIHAVLGSGGKTTYTVAVKDPDGNLLLARWQGRTCGSQAVRPPYSLEAQGEFELVWQHDAANCHQGTPNTPEPHPAHANSVIKVAISDSISHPTDYWEVTCTYTGVATGTGPACSPPVKVEK